MNVMIGLFCENVMASAAHAERELDQAREEQRKQIMAKLQNMFVEMDLDGSQSLSREEFIHAMHNNDEVISCIHDMGLEDEDCLFDTLDINQSGVLNFEEFFEGMILLAKGNDR